MKQSYGYLLVAAALGLGACGRGGNGQKSAGLVAAEKASVDSLVRIIDAW